MIGGKWKGAPYPPVHYVVHPGDVINDQCPFCGQGVVVHVENHCLSFSCCAHADIRIRAVAIGFEELKDAMDRS